MVFTNTAAVLDSNLNLQSRVPLSTALAWIAEGRAREYRQDPYTIILVDGGVSSDSITIGDSGSGALTLAGSMLNLNISALRTALGVTSPVVETHDPVTLADSSGILMLADQQLSLNVQALQAAIPSPTIVSNSPDNAITADFLGAAYLQLPLGSTLHAPVTIANNAGGALTLANQALSLDISALQAAVGNPTIVSTNPDNIISAGADGGAFLGASSIPPSSANSPTVQMGLGQNIEMSDYSSPSSFHINNVNAGVNTWNVAGVADGTHHWVWNITAEVGQVTVSNAVQVAIHDGENRISQPTGIVLIPPFSVWKVIVTNNQGNIFVNWARLSTPFQNVPASATTREMQEGTLAQDRLVSPDGIREAIAALPPSYEPRYYYVLGNAGQSNNYYGESPSLRGIELEEHPRLKQLGRYAYTGDIEADRAGTLTAQSYNQVIPAIASNLHHVQYLGDSNTAGVTDDYKKGTVSAIWYVALRLLPFLPADAGILIVPNARGGAGFTGSPDGSYSVQTGASSNSRNWRVGNPLYTDFISRVKAALDANPDNIYLGTYWNQGEEDSSNAAEASTHNTEFRRLFAQFHSDLNATHARQCVGEDANNCPFIGGSGTYWMRDELAGGETVMRNYFTFADETENFRYIDLSRNPDGTNTDTNADDPNADHRTSSTWHSHFSTRAFRGIISQRIADTFRQMTPTIFAQDVLSSEVDVLESDLANHIQNSALHLPPLAGAIAGQAVLVNPSADGYELGAVDSSTTPTASLVELSFDDATQTLTEAGLASEGAVTEGSVFGGESGVIISDDSSQSMSSVTWPLTTEQLQNAVDNRTVLASRINLPIPSGSFTDEPWQALVIFDFDSAPLTGTFTFERARFWLVFDSNTSGAGGAKLNGGFSTGANDIVFDGLSGRPLIGQNEWFDCEIVWPNGISQDAEVFINTVKVADFTVSEQGGSDRNNQAIWTTGTVGGTNRRILLQSASLRVGDAQTTSTALPAAATQGEAEAGTLTESRLWSPLRVSQAIAANSPIKYEVLGVGSTIDLDAAPTKTGLRHIRFGWGGVLMQNLPPTMRDLSGQSWLVQDDIGQAATYMTRTVVAINQNLSASRMRVNGSWQDWQETSPQRLVHAVYPTVDFDLNSGLSNLNEFRILADSVVVTNPPSGASNTANNFWIVQDLGFSSTNGLRRLWQITQNPPNSPSMRFWERSRYSDTWGRWQERTTLQRVFRVNQSATPPTATAIWLDPLTGNAFTDLAGDTASPSVAGTMVEQELTAIDGNPGVWRRISTNDFEYDSVSPATTEAWRIVGEAGQPAYQNNWIAFSDAANVYTPARFRKTGDVVEIQGLVSNGDIGSVFTLPDGYRPSRRLTKLGVAMNDGAVRFDVMADGSVAVVNYIAGGTNSYVSFECSFGID